MTDSMRRTVAPESGATITVFTKQGGIISKRIALATDGSRTSDASDCKMWAGTASRKSVGTAGKLAAVIEPLESNQALSLGRLPDDVTDGVSVVTKRELGSHPGAIARTNELIDYREGVPGWALIDFDTKGMPSRVADKIQKAGGLWPFLCNAIPALAGVAHVERASTSAGLYNVETGKDIEGSNGLHIYVLVADSSDIPRLLKVLHDLLWLAGAGWHILGKAGQLLERSPIDCSVAGAERLVFEGAPVLEPPLAQRAEKRQPQPHEGRPLDSRAALPSLDAGDRARIEQLRRESARALGKEAATFRRRFSEERVATLVARHGMPVETARRLVSAVHRSILSPHHELEFDELGIVSVGDVLKDPEAYIDLTLADPIEGVAYGCCKAKVMRHDDGSLFIHSFAHGKSIYLLRHDLGSATAAFIETPTIDAAVEIAASSELQADELELFVGQVATTSGVTKRTIARRFKEERRRRDRARRDAAATAETPPDNRIVRARPPIDGELLPEVAILDGILAGDSSPSPPMRGSDGRLIEVRKAVPHNLHTLVSDDEEGAAPPVEPVVAHLTSTGIQFTIERYVRYEVEDRHGVYAASTPRPFIEALNEYKHSSLPVFKVINSSPLITISGEVIDGEGLDRITGIFHCIDPLLRSCLHGDTPTSDEVRKAVAFLLDEWLVDVALDRKGKYLAIMLALTLIERPLLLERPAFFIVAGLRGSGKTTLANMIAMAVLGRRAAATSWSDVSEERKKALFAALRQAVSLIVWDNIRRGETISCPHIEAALTSSQISDRVLGASTVETVPATTIMVFTGNQIAPRGDMASRSLMIALNADSPNPESRKFVHADPLAWTAENRYRIMRALYTLLLAGIRNRPENQAAKTRYKRWWLLVGQPVEYAANLMGDALDCTDLMRASEASDEEASATSAVLNILRSKWGTDRFTARDVVSVLNLSAFPGTTPEHEEKAARAEALSDALGELIGKPLERPTAHSLAKLFQKRLTGRPAWLSDGAVGTLKKSTDHERNEYWVAVTGLAEGLRVPTSDESHPDAVLRDRGEVGKVGIVSGRSTSLKFNFRAPTHLSLSQYTSALRKFARPRPGGPSISPDFADNPESPLGEVGVLGVISNEPADGSTNSTVVGEFPSERDLSVLYRVTRAPTGEIHCTCKSFEFRGICIHVRRVQSPSARLPRA